MLPNKTIEFLYMHTITALIPSTFTFSMILLSQDHVSETLDLLELL